jgi:predicted DNA-binding transcriptional regulator AlpA
MPNSSDTPSTVEFLTEAETADLIRVGRRTLERWRATGDGPPWCRAGFRRVLYPRGGVLAWVAARTYPHRAAELASKAVA